MSQNRFTVPDEVRNLTPNEINKLTNPQLKLALAALIGADNNKDATGPTNADLMRELQEIKEEITGIPQLKQEIEDLKKENHQIKEDLCRVFEILHYQQIFIESVEQHERQKHLIVLGISEDADELGATDVEKVRKVLRAAGSAVDVSACEHQRLGEPDTDRRRRPIKITLASAQDRHAVLACAKNLKQKDEPYKKIFLKKDTHPVIRKETQRLRNKAREEQEKPSNIGVQILYDWKRRVILRDDVVIERFAPRFF